VGTGRLLLPLAEPEAVARSAAELSRASGGRFDLGVGLGYREVEFDGKGIAMSDRLRRSSAALRMLAETAVPAGVRIWNGSATLRGM
ncbi:LLM class flavin-dependent oxidoreductase, partial [Mesorhizobium japonicum]|uniref:LLM class flavin-dependent oxidoreductase n=1 Tax=Mesorhizobium japonicum TaxID=2066070 RepID=UPI003B5B1742